MLAVLRPHSWNLPLFLHVVGAIALFGSTAALAILAWAGTRRPERALLARAAFRTLVFVVLPAWVLTRAGAAWIESKEDIPGDPGWLGVGFMVTEPGLLLLLVATGLAYRWKRRAGAGWQGRVVAILSTLYLIALAVAWWAMSAKPGA